MNQEMRKHTVFIDQDRNPPCLDFPAVFNVAVAFIDRHVEEGRAGHVALRTIAGDVTYGQLADEVGRCANVLKDLGLRRGDRLLLVVRDTPMFFYAFWGAIKAGIIPVAVNTLLKADEYDFLIADSGCAAVVYSTPLGDVIGRTDAARSGTPRTLATDTIDEMMAARSAVFVAEPTNPAEDCFWLYSSGSTGKPKGVVHRHRDMVVTSVLYGMGIAGLRQDDVVFCASKLFFSYGFGGGMTFPLWVGATTVLCEDRSSVEMAFAMIERFRPTYFFGVPTLYGQLLIALETTHHDFSSIRGASSAGESLPAPIFLKWKEKTGISILDGIGSTEVLHIFVSNRADDIRPGTSGKPVPGYQAKIVNDEGTELPQGEIGTLWVKGDSNARCYWNNQEKTGSTMRGEWLNTGDMYYIDGDGYFVNTGRGDDMLKVGGLWCSPLEIEGRLLAHPKVREAAVVAQSDPDGLIKPSAYVVLRNPQDACAETIEELTQHCKSGLAGYKYPRWFTFIDELPKTVTGKIQRFRLRQSDQVAAGSKEQ
jgi:benzoate-CoA ligase family protein